MYVAKAGPRGRGLNPSFEGTAQTPASKGKFQRTSYQKKSLSLPPTPFTSDDL